MRIGTIFVAAIVVAAGVTGLVLALTVPGESQPPRRDQLVTEFTGADVAAWSVRTVGDVSCRVSPAISARGDELNLHRLTVEYSGDGKVFASIAHSQGSDVSKALAKRNFYSRFQAVSSGKEISVSSRYKGERYAWVLLRTEGDVTVTAIRHSSYRGRGTLYGHIPLSYKYEGGQLPYRLLLPRDYDPTKSYPLVISVAGSGGVGTDNARNMEMVILARHLFTEYYDQPEFSCFSLVPQVPSNQAIPRGYHPNGPRGAPDPRFHPDWPAVNAQGWYTQATLSLIHTLMADRRLNIDPDRVYYTGFSYGGKACWEFLKADPDLFAAALCGSGWPIGPAYSKPIGQGLEQLAREVDVYKSVPVWIFAGGADPMRFGSAAVHEQILAAGGVSKYTEFPNTKHVQTATKIWSNPEHIRWLFKQSRKAPSTGALK